MRRALGTSIAVRLVVALLAVQLLAVWLQRPGPDRIEVTADFNRAGLNIRSGDEVRVRGLPVGKVTSIETDRRDFSARYTLSIDPKAPVAAESAAKVVPKTLFGDKYVELDPVRPGGKTIAAGAHIPQDRTKTVTEFQQVLDRFTPALQSIDPDALSGAIEAMAVGIGDGVALGRTASGFGTTFAGLADRQADIASMLRHTPGAAGTFGAHAGDMRAIAQNMGQLSRAMAENEPTLAKFLSENADLLSRAQELMTTEADRIQRVTANGFDVLSLVAAHPGAIAAFLKGQAGTTVGLFSATHYDVMWAGVAHMMVNWVTPMPQGGVQDGRTTYGPEVEINYPAPPLIPGGEGSDPEQDGGSGGGSAGGAGGGDDGGLGGLLDPVRGGG